MVFPERRDDLQDSLAAIHVWALDRFIYVPDVERWKDLGTQFTGDHWESDAEILADLHSSEGVLRGDCDAFAKLCWFLCRRVLIASNLVYCTVETGAGHLVCAASSFVLDNRQQAVVSRDTLEAHGYRFLKMSKAYPSKDGSWNEVMA